MLAATLSINSEIDDMTYFLVISYRVGVAEVDAHTAEAEADQVAEATALQGNTLIHQSSSTRQHLSRMMLHMFLNTILKTLLLKQV